MRLLLLALVSSAAAAQTFDLERVQLNAGAAQTWLAQTGDGLPAGQLRVALAAHYEHRPLVLTTDGQTAGAYVSSRVTAHLLAAYAFFDWLELSAQLPVVAFQTGDDLSRYGLSRPQQTAMGAPWLGLRSTILRQRAQQHLDLGISLNVSFPAGTAAALTRDAGAGLAFAPKLGAGRAFGPVRVGLEAGVLLRNAGTVAGDTENAVGSQFNGALVVSTYELPVHAELAARVVAPFTTAKASVELTGAVGYTFAKQFELTLLGGPGFGKTPGVPAFRVMLAFAWTPQFTPL